MRELLFSYEKNIASAAVFEQGQLCAFLQEKPALEAQKEQIYRARIIEKAKGMQAVFALLPNERKVFVEQCNGVAGSMILVQIKREAVGEKMPLATTELSLPGRFSVVHTRDGKVSVSKKITNEEEIARLKKIGAPGAFGVTFRTGADGVARELLETEIANLSAQLETILKEGKQDGGPALLYGGMPFWQKTMREYLDKAVERILVEDVELYQELRKRYPEAPIRLHTGEYSLFSLYAVEPEVRKAFSRTIWLKSGAYLVIDPTEAMTVIDVNSGKYSKQKDFDSMADAINREAAVEIARILRLRNIRGIIVVDFLKNEDKAAQQEFLQFFREYLKADKGKTELVDMTALGLVELTRRAD